VSGVESFAISAGGWGDAERWERREAVRKRIAAHPLVRAVIEELGAELKDVKVSEE
jgi:hypothetical protein